MEMTEEKKSTLSKKYKDGFIIRFHLLWNDLYRTPRKRNIKITNK